MCIEASTGLPVDPWAGNRRRAGIYSGAQGHHKRVEETQRTLRDVSQSAADLQLDAD